MKAVCSYQELHDKLQLSTKDLLSLGTLRLETVIAQVEAPESSESIWTTWTPGCFEDLHTPTRDYSTSSVTKSRGAKRGVGNKRRRSSAASSELQSHVRLPQETTDLSTSASIPSASPSKGKQKAVQISLPSCKDIDQLVQNAFARIEYRILSTYSQTDSLEESETYCSVLLRIYAIPLDTPDLNSRLNLNGLRDLRSGSKKRAAEAALKRVFHHLRYDTLEWTTGEWIDSAAYTLPHDLYPPSLADIYNDLDDPEPMPLEASDKTHAVLRDIMEEDAPEGMHSRLYPHQKNCLWKLASRELAPQKRFDLTFSPVLSIDNPPRRYFINPNYLIFFDAPLYIEPKSAIVAEGMGTGKTCICLALVLTTRGALAAIDESKETVTISTVRTARHEEFPWVQEEEEDDLERRITKKRKIYHVPDMDRPAVEASPWQTRAVPSLRDLALDYLASQTHHRNLLEDSTLAAAITDRDLPYFWETPTAKGREDTRSSARERRKIYVSAATLVVVPDILVAQWLAEIEKHIKEGALDYIRIDKNDAIPSSSALSKVDLVLIGESKIRAEAGRDREWALAPQLCRCPYIGNTREIYCKCKAPVDLGTSSLTGVYWKRLIVDEGHKVAGKGDLVKMCMKLRCESRYIVSGTPSKNLVGSNDVQPGHSHSSGLSSAIADKNDFERLANISTFLQLQPFCSENNPFMRAFHEPYVERGDITGITSFLDRTMIRHKIPDIMLPPLTTSIAVLEFNELEKMTYNVLLALFASNAVQSERTDEDYFFHPQQKAALNALISNLGAAHLLFSSPELTKVIASAVTSNITAIEANQAKIESKRWSLPDFLLLQQAQMHLNLALNSGLWRHAQTGSMLYVTEGMPNDLMEAWGGLQAGSRSHHVTGERLSALKHQIAKQAEDLVRITAKDVDADGNGAAISNEDDFVEDLITFAHKEKQRQQEAEMVKRTGKNPGQIPRVARKRDADAPSARRAATDAYKSGTSITSTSCVLSNLPVTSVLPYASLSAMASTKVAYIVKVANAHPDEKMLVFAGGSSSNQQVANNNLYYVAEALDHAHIPHLILARTLSQNKLAAYVRAFNESTNFRLLLLDIKFAGRGLTLSSATRVIFMEPVWQKDEEAQAVKRAHRLGQTKPVHVETLIMKGSFEERVFKRGSQLNRRETLNAKTPYDDLELSIALRSMEFLPTALQEGEAYPSLSAFSSPIRLLQDKTADLDLELENQVLKQQLSKADERAKTISPRPASPFASIEGEAQRSASPELAKPLKKPVPSTSEPTPVNFRAKSPLKRQIRMNTSDESDSVYVVSRPTVKNKHDDTTLSRSGSAKKQKARFSAENKLGGPPSLLSTSATSQLADQAPSIHDLLHHFVAKAPVEMPELAPTAGTSLPQQVSWAFDQEHDVRAGDAWKLSGACSTEGYRSKVRMSHPREKGSEADTLPAASGPLLVRDFMPGTSTFRVAAPASRRESTATSLDPSRRDVRPAADDDDTEEDIKLAKNVIRVSGKPSKPTSARKLSRPNDMRKARRHSSTDSDSVYVASVPHRRAQTVFLRKKTFASADDTSSASADDVPLVRASITLPTTSHRPIASKPSTTSRASRTSSSVSAKKTKHKRPRIVETSTDSSSSHVEVSEPIMVRSTWEPPKSVSVSRAIAKGKSRAFDNDADAKQPMLSEPGSSRRPAISRSRAPRRIQTSTSASSDSKDTPLITFCSPASQRRIKASTGSSRRSTPASDDSSDGEPIQVVSSFRGRPVTIQARHTSDTSSDDTPSESDSEPIVVSSTLKKPPSSIHTGSSTKSLIKTSPPKADDTEPIMVATSIPRMTSATQAGQSRQAPPDTVRTSVMTHRQRPTPSSKSSPARRSLRA